MDLKQQLKQIGKWEQKKAEILKIKDHGERNIDLINLSREIGAMPCTPGKANPTERDAESVSNINHALQMRIMIVNSKIALKNSRIAFIMATIAFITAIIALGGALATWIGIFLK